MYFPLLRWCIGGYKRFTRTRPLSLQYFILAQESVVFFPINQIWCLRAAICVHVFWNSGLWPGGLSEIFWFPWVYLRPLLTLGHSRGSSFSRFLCNSPYEPIEDCSLYHLSRKITFLFTVTLAKRIWELQAFHFKQPYILFPDTFLSLRVYLKNSSIQKKI